MDVIDSTFEQEVLEKSKTTPVMVDFWASWCGPCMMLKPVIEKVAADYEGKIILAKVNVEENQENAGKFGVMGIPAVKMFKNGEIVDEFTGAQPEESIRAFVEKNL